MGFSGWDFPGGRVVKNAGDSGDSGWSLGQEDPLEEETATHSIILALEIQWRNPILVGYSS